MSSQALRTEVEEHQAEVDKFTDQVQALMQTTSDVRLPTYVSTTTSRYDNLHTAVRDQLSRYVTYTTVNILIKHLYLFR